MRIDLPSEKKMSFYASGPLPLYDDLFLCLQTGRWDEFLLPLFIITWQSVQPFARVRIFRFQAVKVNGKLLG